MLGLSGAPELGQTVLILPPRTSAQVDQDLENEAAQDIQAEENEEGHRDDDNQVETSQRS